MIKTFSSRAGRLSPTNKNYLNLKSACLINPENKPKTNYPIVLDIGFGDAQSFVQDIIINNKFCFIGIEPYKKGFARAVEFYETDPWPKKKHIKRRLISQNFLLLLDQKILKTGKIEIITDSKIYQNHIDDVLHKQNIFKQTDSFEISYEVSTFHNKGLKKGHQIKRYILTKA